MKLHANAALSLNQRRRLARRIVEEGWSLTEAAEAAEVSERTAAKWAGRFRAEGDAGILDRSCAAGHVHNRTCERRIALICSLRPCASPAPRSPRPCGCPKRPSRGSSRELA